MKIITVTIAGGIMSRDFGCNVITILGVLLLWGATTVAADTDMLVFHLTRTNSTSVVNEYAMEMRLGTMGYSPNIFLLPVLYTSEYYNAKNGGPKPLYVPSAELCLNQKEQEEWNSFLSPEPGELINTAAPYEVEWDASIKTKEVNLSLREGSGADGKNITVIEMGINNNGIFEWQAAKTKKEQNIGDDVEVSLMLWTDNPPQRSYSPTFTMREIRDTEDMRRFALRRRSSSPGSKAYAQCMSYLLNNGGVYNHTEDTDFTLENNVYGVGTFKDAVSGWEVKVTNTGSTTVTYQTQEIRGNGVKNVTAVEMGVNLMKSDTQGMGTVALSEIQRRRNRAGDEAKNVVSIYLGSGDVAGHVVMGGYDRALIDQAQGSAVYGKRNLMDGQFEVQLVGITFVPDGNERRSLEPRVSPDEVRIPMDRTQLRLSFNSPTIYLPEAILEDLLPRLGAPVYSRELNGHVYEASAKTDYSLRFHLANSTSGNFVNITIPASSLLTRETINDNPLTDDVVESGREYLLLAPLRTSNGRMGYLGRAFLQHLYMVDDSYLNKFFISAINTTAVKEGASSLMTGSVGLMDSTPIDIPPLPETSSSSGSSDTGHNSKSSIVGAVLGGVIGGIALLWIIFLFFYLRKRRARSQLNSQSADEDVDYGDKTLEKGIASIFGSGGTRGVRDFRFHNMGEETQFGGISKEVGPPPVATLREGKQPIPSTIPHSALAISGVSPSPYPKTSLMDQPPPPPPPPVKDEEYFRTAALARKRFSQPLMKAPDSPLGPSNRKRQSAPAIALEAMGEGPYARYLRVDDITEEEIQSPSPIPTYHQLLAHHEARRQRASYIDSESSNGNENDANTSNTSSTETATVGKVIAKGQVAKIRQLSSTPPHVALANTLERRASVGRVISPGEVVIVPPSRRTSRSSRELLRSPRKSISPAASSSHSAEVTAEGATVGHRRGKSAPSDLGFPLSSPSLPPPRAQDDIFVGGMRMVGGRPVGQARRIPNSPPPRRIEEDGIPNSFLDDAPEEEVSSSSSTVLPRGARLIQRSDSESSGEKAPSPVSPLSERGDGADYLSGGRARDSIVSPVSPLTPPPFERTFS